MTDQLGAARANLGNNAGGASGLADDHDLKEQIRDLSRETIALIRQEFELVKAELGEKTDFLKDQLQVTTTQAKYEIAQAKTELAEAGKKAGIGAGLFGAATLLGLGAFAAFTVALIAGLGEVMPVWIAAALVTLVYGAIGGVLALAGSRKVKEVGSPVPETVGRFKNLFQFRSAKIKDELSEIPQQAIGTLNTVKDDVQDAWKRGSKHQHGSWR